MAQLIVRKLEDKVVRRLKERAAEYGVSMEEAHRRILRETLLKKEKPKLSFMEYVAGPPYVDVDLMDYIPKRDKRHRKVDLSG
jgi:plasmid stability protein